MLWFAIIIFGLLVPGVAFLVTLVSAVVALWTHPQRKFVKVAALSLAAGLLSLALFTFVLLPRFILPPHMLGYWSCPVAGHFRLIRMPAPITPDLLHHPPAPGCIPDFTH